MIDPENFSPFPKNPTIAKFFKEIGLVDELGSGVRNISKYNKIYSRAEPRFVEGDVFKTVIPLVPQTTSHSNHVGDHVGDHAEQYYMNVLEFCETPRSRAEIQDFIGISSRRYFREKVLEPLIREGLLSLTIPDKPKSPKQRYYSRKQNNR